jgi:hypothetical protein
MGSCKTGLVARVDDVPTQKARSPSHTHGQSRLQLVTIHPHELDINRFRYLISFLATRDYQ